MAVAKDPDSEQEITLKQLVDQYQSMLLRLCTLYLHDVHLAEDAVQETFIKAAHALTQFRGESSAKTWLTRIAVRTCCDIRRGTWFRYINRRVTPEMLPEPIQPASEQDQALTFAVMNLPIKLRETIILYYYQDMSTVEIAEMLGISQPTVSYRLKQGRDKLRTQLEGREPL